MLFPQLLVLVNTFALEQHVAVLVESIRSILVRCSLVPRGSFLRILLDTRPSDPTDACEVELSLQVSLLGRLTIPSDGLPQIGCEQQPDATLVCAL